MMAFLMLMRTGFLVLMAAALPIAGAAGGTKIGSQAFDKMIAWTIAWLLVKPVGAFVIGCSAMLFLKATPTISNPDNGDALMALTGVILLCAAALVLPSLMRMIVPTSALSAAVAVVPPPVRHSSPRDEGRRDDGPAAVHRPALRWRAARRQRLLPAPLVATPHDYRCGATGPGQLRWRR
ncbi:hypothetical protein GS966_29875 [Rhodococcus hoagii]|nr:hypothetical protein [Prescottella equi]